MAYWGSRALIKFTEFSYGLAATTLDHTINVGNAEIDGITYSGAAIDANITASADIDTPDNWKTMVAITGGPLVVSLNGYIEFQTSETGGGEKLRMQILIDGVAVWDAKVVPLDANDQYVGCYNPESAWDGTRKRSFPIFCESTFTVKAARIGAFTDANSYVKTPTITYHYIELK